MYYCNCLYCAVSFCESDRARNFEGGGLISARAGEQRCGGPRSLVPTGVYGSNTAKSNTKTRLRAVPALGLCCIVLRAEASDKHRCSRSLSTGIA
eukprot:1524529-Rhodomonas_salina.1